MTCKILNIKTTSICIFLSIQQKELSMSNTLKSNRSASKLPQPKPISIKVLCPLHNQPIVRVQVQTKTLLCQQCQESTSKLNLQTQRIKATNLFKQFIKQYKKSSQELDKVLNMCKQPNLSQFKRSIKSSLPQIQYLIDQKMQQLIAKGNQRIQTEIGKEMKQWQFMNGEEVTSLNEITQMLNYKEIFEQSRNRIEGLKAQIKKEIAIEVKKVVRQFYEAHLQI